MQDLSGQVRKYIPIRTWLQTYKRENLVKDLEAGVIVSLSTEAAVRKYSRRFPE